VSQRSISPRVFIGKTFWSKVRKTSSCWIWSGAMFGNGYGHFRIDGRDLLTHRLAWQDANGPIPKGKLVLHNCPGGDNRACCNPAHLWLGTHKQNSRDAVAKGRWNPGRFPGEKHNHAKLKNKDVRRIRRLRQKGMSYYKIGKLYSITRGNARNICLRKTWQHI
jgi:hypothetical protein